MEVPGNLFKRNRLAGPSPFSPPEAQVSHREVQKHLAPTLTKATHEDDPMKRWKEPRQHGRDAFQPRTAHPWAALHGRKINPLFSKATVSKAFCKLQADAFLTHAITFCACIFIAEQSRDAPHRHSLAND